MNTQRPATLPDDVLLIHYATIAPNTSSSVRLGVLAALGRLLDRGEAASSLEDLCQEEEVLDYLTLWLRGDEGSNFWRLEEQRVIPLRPCRKHILVGTRQLLDDLSTSTVQPERDLPDLDTLWRAADTFVERQREVE